MTPFEFGGLVKQSFFPGAIGTGLGAYQAPEGHKLEGAGRGLVRDLATQLGAGLGAVGGIHAGGLPGALLGAGAGGLLGYHGAGKLMPKPSWKNNTPAPAPAPAAAPAAAPAPTPAAPSPVAAKAAALRARIYANNG